MMDVRQFRRLPKTRDRRQAPAPEPGGLLGDEPAQDSPSLLGREPPQTYGVPGARTSGLDEAGQSLGLRKPPWLDEYYDHWSRQKTLQGPLVGDKVLSADRWSPALQSRYKDWRRRQQDPAVSMTPRDFIMSDEMTSWLPLRGAVEDDLSGQRSRGVMPIPGVLPEAARAYQADQVTPGEARFVQDEGRALRDRYGVHQADEAALHAGLKSGDYDVPNQVTPGLQAQMTGHPDLSAYDPVVQHALDKLNDQFERRTLRSLRQGAEAAGQTGGTREGIAEGLAAQGLAEAQSGLAKDFYLNAYRDAQSRVLPATELGARLNERATQGKLNNRLQLLRQNAYEEDQASKYLDRMMALWGYPGNRNWENLDRYSRLVQGMNLGNSVSQPLHRNKWAGALGGGLSGYAATGNPWGAGVGALAGLLGGGR
ncbi:MAG: hypothetical protein G8D89_06645 [gamma proteobacterium symbiont of Clathrolucina costata]|uniref:Uncharacterized protein n=1 Tax=Candidatus Thiodiazotropha taylori TaxID=2792791 RepID=A0A9E4TUN1_9GAMM|nr:hypothetical protein [Candidatus Thiodiazotropha taylori]MCW4238032.1 hypothetical protein [Candidatus Thiodiazotropha endolucinida]